MIIKVYIHMYIYIYVYIYTYIYLQVHILLKNCLFRGLNLKTSTRLSHGERRADAMASRLAPRFGGGLQG